MNRESKPYRLRRGRNSLRTSPLATTLRVIGILILGFMATGGKSSGVPDQLPRRVNTSGLPGETVNSRVLENSQPSAVQSLAKSPRSEDLDLPKMAGGAMNYLINNPRKHLDYEPVFQIKPMMCPPVPEGHDPIVPGDTDCRMDWEFMYMREMSGSRQGLDVERGIRQRILGYIGKDNLAWIPPGLYLEGTVYGGREIPPDKVASTWTAVKIIRSLSETYIRTHDAQSKELARKMFVALRRLATWNSGRAYFEGGSGAWKDGKWLKEFVIQPTVAVEPIVRYWEATNDGEALEFAIALTEGLMASPELMKDTPAAQIEWTGDFKGHTHSTLNSVWGVAHLGAVLKESRYIEWAKRVYDFANNQHSIGTGWVKASLANPSVQLLGETCNTADMVSLATWIAQSGYPEYWDHVERYIRNYIRHTQFFITPSYESLFRTVHRDKSAKEVEACLTRMKDFEGGFIGIPAPNDWASLVPYGPVDKSQPVFMSGCCPPEGMRALYTAWSSVIIPAREGVFVNLSLNRDSPAARTVSFLPNAGRLTVTAKRAADFFVRPPSWAPREKVVLFLNAQRIDTTWVGPGRAYVKFSKAKEGDELTITYPLLEFTQKVAIWPERPDLVFRVYWRGNTVTQIDPQGKNIPMFVKPGP